MHEWDIHILVKYADGLRPHIPTCIYEPYCEKTGLRGFRPGLTQPSLHSHRRWLEA